MNPSVVQKMVSSRLFDAQSKMTNQFGSIGSKRLVGVTFNTALDTALRCNARLILQTSIATDPCRRHATGIYHIKCFNERPGYNMCSSLQITEHINRSIDRNGYQNSCWVIDY